MTVLVDNKTGVRRKKTSTVCATIWVRTGGKKTSQGAQKNGAITLHTPVPADQKDWKTRAMAAEVKLKEKEKELAKERKRREREGESFICTFQCQSLSGN